MPRKVANLLLILLASCGAENGLTRRSDATHGSRFRAPGAFERPAVAEGLSLLGTFDFRTRSAHAPGPYFFDLRVLGGRAYVVAPGSLRILDVSDPAAIREIGYRPTDGERWNDVEVVQRGALTIALLSGDGGTDLLDVSDPAGPALLGRAEWGHVLAVHGDLVFTTGESTAIEVWRISDPKRPVAVGQFDLPPELTRLGATYARDLWTDGERAYVCYAGGGLVVVDFSDPARPRYLGRFTHPGSSSHSVAVTRIGGRSIAIHGAEDFDAQVQVLDVTDPTAIRLLGDLPLRRSVSIHNIRVVGHRAHVAWHQDGYWIDLSDPARPRVTAHYTTMTEQPDAGARFEGPMGADRAADDPEGNLHVLHNQRGLIVLR